jgi:hypothetical protein
MGKWPYGTWHWPCVCRIPCHPNMAHSGDDTRHCKQADRVGLRYLHWVSTWRITESCDVTCPFKVKLCRPSWRSSNAFHLCSWSTEFEHHVYRGNFGKCLEMGHCSRNANFCLLFVTIVLSDMALKLLCNVVNEQLVESVSVHTLGCANLITSVPHIEAEMLP